MKEELIINYGAVPTDDDSKVSESTAENYHASSLCSLLSNNHMPCMDIRYVVCMYTHD